MDELDNQITKTTSACFEPTLDYVVVKIPRWNFDKFDGCDRQLGLQMKSVGEVMAIGRSFQEALQKACQSLEIKRNGLGADGKGWVNQDKILDSLKEASWNRVFRIYDAINLGISINTIQKLTGIDKIFIDPSTIQEELPDTKIITKENIIKVEKGDTLSLILNKQPIEKKYIQKIIDEIGKIFNLKKLKIGQQIVFDYKYNANNQMVLESK